MRAVCLSLCCLVVGCPSETGTLQPGEGEGEGEEGPSAADIGSRCVYARDGAAPSNTCPLGMHCLISTSDGAFVDYFLPAWEDQVTLYLPDHEEGYCTLVGTFAAPPACPAGTEAKVFAGGIVACLRPCGSPADCGRAGYVCDTRFLDAPGPHCVRGCTLDVPDCVRGGTFLLEGNGGNVAPVLSLEDMGGASQCDVDSGLCESVVDRALGPPGAPCQETADCAVGSACLQGPLLAVVVGAPDPGAPGFCASPCDPALQAMCDEGGPCPCTIGEVCQEAGALTLGYPEPIFLDQASQLSLGGGFCFSRCEGGVAGNCSHVPATECGSVDEAALGAAWNGISMCLPDAIRP